MDVSHRLELRVVDSSDELYNLKSSWEAILEKLGECPPFLTWEWMYTWWEVYKTNTMKLLVLVISDNSNIVAIAPFYVRASSYLISCKTVYFLGTGEPENKEVCSEYLDIISIPSYSKAVSSEINSYFVANHEIWDRVELQRVLDTSILRDYFLRGLLENKYKVQNKKCGMRYFIVLPDQWDKYIKSLKSSMRRSITVAYKNLQEKPNCKIEFIGKESQLKSVMEELIELHTKSWNKKDKPGAFSSREFCEFHLKVASLMLKKNSLQMLKISLPNDVVAVLYNFKIMGVSYYYQSGLNIQKFSSLKPGVLLHSEAIKYAIDESMSKYDFMMAGQNTYKSRYGCDTSNMFHIRVWNKGMKPIFLQKLALLPYFNRLK